MLIDNYISSYVDKTINGGIKIDDFEIIAEENNRLKLQAVDWAVEICKNYQDELNRDMIFHDEFGTGENIDREKTVSLAKR